MKPSDDQSGVAAPVDRLVRGGEANRMIEFYSQAFANVTPESTRALIREMRYWDRIEQHERSVTGRLSTAWKSLLGRFRRRAVRS